MRVCMEKSAERRVRGMCVSSREGKAGFCDPEREASESVAQKQKVVSGCSTSRAEEFLPLPQQSLRATSRSSADVSTELHVLLRI